MARYLYDVNTLQRYIDVHKQFQGGLKTVDTDDALKDIYLREAENVSLSEFNFIEKRYGTHKLAEHKPWTSLEDSNSPLQGYFEYYVDANTVHKIVAIEGQFYIDQGSGFQRVEFFTKEENTPFIDLSSLGIYTEDLVNTMYTGTNFGTQIPRFAENTTVLSTLTGAFSNQKIYVFSNDSYYNWNASVPAWQIMDPATEIEFIPAAGFVQGEYYYDSRTLSTYKWTGITGKTGLMTVNESFYKADFQKIRSVEGVRIDDKFYIATGTYPVYYKGDGKIYVLPKYIQSDLDIQNLGYNLNSLDLEDDFTAPAFTATSSHGTTLNGETVAVDTITIKDSQISKRFPYVGETIPTQLKIATHLYNNASLNRWGGTGSDVATDVNLFDSVMSNAELNAWLGTPTAGQTNTIYGQLDGILQTFNNRRYRYSLKPTLYIKPAGGLNSLYEQVIDTNFIEITNDVQSGSGGRLPTSSISLNNFVIDLRNLTNGYWDFKVEIRLVQKGFFLDNELSLPEGVTLFTVREKNLDTKIVEFLNVWVTPEELTDYTEEPYTSLKCYSCNRITEHNGRLALFGHPVYTDYIFFSTASAKEYFPYFYSIQFNNDLKEAINSITRFMNILVVQSDSYTWGLKGDAPLPLSALEGDVYKKITINPTIGCIAPYSVKNVRNQLYFLSKEGIFTLRALYAEDNRYNVDPIDRNIYNIVPRDTNAIAAYFDDQYWLHFPNSGETLRYYVDKKAWVKDTYKPFNIFGGVFKYINESGKLRFITKLSQLEDGQAFKVFDIEVDYSLPTDLTENIISKFTTSFLNQNYPFHLKNYKEAKFDFAIQNEYNTSNENLPISNYAENINYVQFDVDLIDRHFYSITFQTNEINSPYPAAYIVEIDNVQVASGNITLSGSNLSTIRFMSNKTDNATVKITVTGKVNTTNMSVDSIKLYDSTYDHTVTFNTLVLSEEGTLNVDPIDSYTEADVEIPIDLGTRTGNWTFGTSNFGNIIVAIKTVKLAGRGYNNKVSVIEDSKSKWTLESLGITYKMKKARSR
jgi:hypothetical protein